MAGVDEKRAWNLYLAQTRNLIGWRYEQQEPYAWASLQSRLGNLKVKKVVKKVA